MRNPLVELVASELARLGMVNAKLVYESYHPQSFGDAEAVYELGNMRLRFLRDRSDDTVSIASSISPRHFYGFEDVAIWKGWIGLDELLKYDTPIDFDKPPPGPVFGLAKALKLIATDIVRLDKEFSIDELMATRAKLTSIERMRIGKMNTFVRE